MKKLTKILSLALILALTSFSFTATFATQTKDKTDVTIKWFGHSSFGISDVNGMQIVTDPYAPDMGYTFPKEIKTDILTLSHDHFDHYNHKALEKYAHCIEGVETFSHNGIDVKGIASYHDEKKGELRGKNTIFTYSINKVKVCHLGDLGHVLTKDQIKAIGKVDVLMIPVGGVYTIDAKAAAEVVKQVNPKIVIPMHYKTEALPAEFGDVDNADKFIAAMKDWKVEKSDALTISRATLDKSKGKRIVVLSYK